MRKNGMLGVLLLCLLVLFPFARNAGINYVALKAGSALYALEGFEEAGVVFKDITKKCRGSSCATGRYNLGNSLYFRGENTSGEEKIVLWGQSVDAYESALGFEKDDNYREKIEHNKKVVEDRLEELGVSPEEEENQEQESEQGDEGNQGEDQESEEGEQDQQEQGESESGTEGEEGSEGASSEGGTLSESQRQQLEQYQELLEQQQQKNQEFFAPIPSSMQEQPQSLLDQFFGGDRLQRSLPKGGGVDW